MVLIWFTDFGASEFTLSQMKSDQIKSNIFFFLLKREREHRPKQRETLHIFIRFDLIFFDDVLCRASSSNFHVQSEQSWGEYWTTSLRLRTLLSLLSYSKLIANGRIECYTCGQFFNISF